MLPIEQMLNRVTNSTFLTFRRIEMKIQDLSKELDTETMSAVRGGDNGNSAVNSIGQGQNLYVPVGVGAAGPANTSVHVKGTQKGSICSDQFTGDSLSAMLPTFSTTIIPF
jgi:hypothetical protein